MNQGVKTFVATFSAVLAAGLVLFFVWSNRVEQMRAQDRAIAAWTKEAEDAVRSLESADDDRSRAIRYQIARTALDHAPPGSDSARLKHAVDMARMELDVSVAVASKRTSERR